MRVSEFLAAMLLWQSALLVNIGAAAAPEHLRFERALLLPAGAQGAVCATLNAEVLAHTASAAHNDLRIYRDFPGSRAQAETPYRLTESGPEPVRDAQAIVRGVTRSGGALHFDLTMPTRAYSEVDLQLRVHDFVGTVVVAADEPRGARRNLGTFAIFDLTQKGLGRWTVLPMAESSAGVLHLTLSLRTPEGRPVTALPVALIAGAAVPPSRERQTAYTAVTSAPVSSVGDRSVAVLAVPAHVPVERISFRLPAGFDSNYLREVLVRARTEGDPAAEAEMMDAGAIQHVRWAPGDPRLNPIDVTNDSLDATTGATLAGPATVRVTLVNGRLPPLPVEQVTLEMRERKVCFLTVAGAQYTLRYGDPALAAPVYDPASSSAEDGNPPQRSPLEGQMGSREAQLGPERRNPGWRPREDGRSYLDRHPEVFWLAVLACAGMMGGTALHFVQHRSGGGRG